MFRPAFARAFSISSSRYAASSYEVRQEAMGMVADISFGSQAPSQTASSQKITSSKPPPPSPPSRNSKQDHSDIVIPPAEDPLLSYVASHIMKHGRRQRANRIVARTLLHIHTLTRAPPLPIFREAILAAAPAVRIISYKHSTKTIYKPIALSERKRTWYAIEWLRRHSSMRPGVTFEERLAREMISILQGESGALKKKEEIHKMAMINRGNVKATVPR